MPRFWGFSETVAPRKTRFPFFPSLRSSALQTRRVLFSWQGFSQGRLEAGDCRLELRDLQNNSASASGGLAEFSQIQPTASSSVSPFGCGRRPGQVSATSAFGFQNLSLPVVPTELLAKNRNIKTR